MTGVLVDVVAASHSEVGVGTDGNGFGVLEPGRSFQYSAVVVVAVVGDFGGFVVGDTQREVVVGFVGFGGAVLVVVGSGRTAVLAVASSSRSWCWVD